MHQDTWWKNYGKSFSFEGQDQWVLNVLDGKTSGTYLEIGAGHPENGNNTFLLEKEFCWTGVGIEIEEQLVDVYTKQRANPCLIENAISANYREILSKYEMPKNIDYLQIDIDFKPQHANFMALTAIPLSDYSFSVMTIEHGCINDYKMQRMRDSQRLLLESFGYRLIVQGNNEDWWINPKYVDYERYSMMFSIGRLDVPTT